MYPEVTPSAVRLFRANALGLGISTFTMFAAFLWMLGDAASAEPIIWVVLGGGGLFASAIHLLPAFVPRKSWGYVIAWTEIAFAIMTGTALLPTIPVIIYFARSEVKAWFDGKRIERDTASPTASRAAMIAIVGYYALMTALPLGLVAWIGQIEPTPSVSITKHLDQTNQVEVRRGKVRQIDHVDPAAELRAKELLTNKEWSLLEQPGATAVTIWATHCRACDRQLKTLADNPLPADVQQVTLALDCDRDVQRVRQKLSESGIKSQPVCGQIDVDVLPTTIFFDSSGQRRVTMHGSQSTNTMHSAARAVAPLY